MILVKLTASFNASTSSNITSLSSRSVPAKLPWRDSSSLSREKSTASNSTIESSPPRDPRVPATNSNGDYVTSLLMYLTETYTYSSTTFTWNSAVILGPTTVVTTLSYTELDAVHYGPIKPSDVPQIWDRSPFDDAYVYPEDLSSFSAAWSSFTKFGREPACTAAFSSFIATQPTTTETFTFAKSFTLPNGRSTVGVVYNTFVGTPEAGMACCAKCTLIFQSLEMLYWPGPHPQTICITTSGSTAENAIDWSTLDSGQGGSEPDVYATGSDGYILSVLQMTLHHYTPGY